jgi:hypothetical protein
MGNKLTLRKYHEKRSEGACENLKEQALKQG